MLALGWGLAAAIGSVAGMMAAPIVYLDPNMMGGVLLYAFAGAVLGGIDNPWGAVLGGFVVGVLENLVAYIGNLIEKFTGVYIIGNGEKLTVARSSATSRRSRPSARSPSLPPTRPAR